MAKYGKVLIVNADTKGDETVVDNWINYDFVIHTPTVEAGVNFIAPDHFDYICGYFFRNKNTYDSCYQMLFRCRNPKNKEIFLFAQYGKKLTSIDCLDNKETDRIIKVNKKMIGLGFNDTSFKYDKYDSPIYSMIKRQYCFKKYSTTKFRELLIDELKKTGIEIVISSFEPIGHEIRSTTLEIQEHMNNEAIDRILGNQSLELQIKLHEIKYPINEEKLKVFTEMYRMESTIQTKKTQFLTVSTAINYVYNYVIVNELYKNGKKMKQLDNIQLLAYILLKGFGLNKLMHIDSFSKSIDGFLDSRYDIICAVVEKKNYKKEQMKLKRLTDKLQFLNLNVLVKCRYKFERHEKGNDTYYYIKENFAHQLEQIKNDIDIHRKDLLN